MTCPVATTDLGAYVLGALEPDERRRVDEHLRLCPSCARELTEFAALPGVLDRVRPGDLRPVAVTPSPDLFARVTAAAAPPPQHRARVMALVAAAVLAVLGIGAGVTVWATESGEESVTASAGAVRATVTASTVDDGSALVVTVAGMHPGETCRLVAVDSTGALHPAGTWPASPAGDGTWRGWADVERADLTEVVLLGDGGRELVRVPF
ncbi:zf-HC2 domain-containing protein [Blastococcus sp. CT_GayMR16]|uniref:anti-sigma factor family protein n=1 Tax=Blastococcus sp. CT_GayMR16 TaxID=2559607 RepID=UPI001431DDEC|nr:zf-HC2 domain-containing protein [Blastococcus sp. CT_GayMR16]